MIYLHMYIYAYSYICMNIYVHIFICKWIYIHICTYIYIKLGIMTYLFFVNTKKYYVSESWYIYEARHHGVSVGVQRNSHESWLKIHGWWMMMSDEWRVMRHDSWLINHNSWAMTHEFMTHDSWVMSWPMTLVTRDSNVMTHDSCHNNVRFGMIYRNGNSRCFDIPRHL